MTASATSLPTSSRYPLTGIRAATTDRQHALLTRARQVLEADPRLLAGYLVGSTAVGQADAFSDVDLQCIVDPDAFDEIKATWRDIAQRIAATVSIEPFFVSTGGVCITPEWDHFDLVFHPVGKVDPATVEGMDPLFDKAGLLPARPVPRPSGRGEPFLPIKTINWFLYMLGNVVSPIARNEPVPLSNAVLLMRDMGLIPLFLAEQGMTHVPPGRKTSPLNPFPFTKRLRPYLTDEQNAILTGLPVIEASIDASIDGIVTIARLFIPRGRQLAATTGTPWPADFEQASVTHFEKSIGLDLRLDDR